MSRAELIKQTSIIPIGGSEDETANEVKKLFRATASRYESLTQEDTEYLQKQHEAELMAEAELVF